MHSKSGSVKDIVSGTIALTFGVIAAVMSWSLDIGHPSRPSPGFFPFLTSVGMVILGAILLLHGFRNRRLPEPEIEGSKWNWRAGACLVVLAAYAHFMELLGFTLSTFLSMSALFALVGLLPWYRAALAGAGTAAVSGLVFGILLKMTLPTGPFGF